MMEYEVSTPESREDKRRETLETLYQLTEDLVRLDMGTVLVNGQFVVTLLNHRWRHVDRWTWYRGHDDITTTYEKHKWGGCK